MLDPEYQETAEDGVFTLRFKAAKQLLLHPEFEQMVWDETLRRAHVAGHMPVGPIFIETAEYEPPPAPQTELIEGESLFDRMTRWSRTQDMSKYVMEGMAGQLGPVTVDLMQVTASVQLGLSID